MTRLFEFLSKPQILWTNFIAVLALAAGFVWVMAAYDFQIIDEMFNPKQILSHVEAMNAEQRLAHAWTTGTLDVLFPFAYGGLFIGLAIRYFEDFGPWLAASSVLVIPVDLIEGLVQILLLNGVHNIVWIKAVVTPLKLLLFQGGLVISCVGLCVSIYRGRKAKE